MIILKIELFMLGKISLNFQFIQNSINLNIRATHNDEMCNIYTMYSYEPPKKSTDPSPLQMCWADEFSKIAK